MPHDPDVADAVARAVKTFDATPFSVRVAGSDDASTILALLDHAVVWLNSIGVTEQWGTRSWSSDPKRVDAVEGWVASGEAVVAYAGTVPAGALRVGEATPYAPPSTEPELYVVALVGGRDPRARGAGAALLGFADAVARELGVGKLRVDCYAGGDQALVRFYEGAGYTRTDPFEVDGWPGQVLERRLDPLD